MKGFIDAQLPLVTAAQSRETLDALLATYTAGDADRAAKFVMLSFAINGFIKGLSTAAAEQPLPSGPPVKIDVDMCREVIRFLTSLFSKKVRISDAQTRAAQKFGINKRSVQRIWQQRGELAEQPFQTLEDIWEFLKS